MITAHFLNYQNIVITDLMFTFTLTNANRLEYCFIVMKKKTFKVGWLVGLMVFNNHLRGFNIDYFIGDNVHLLVL